MSNDYLISPEQIAELLRTEFGVDKLFKTFDWTDDSEREPDSVLEECWRLSEEKEVELLGWGAHNKDHPMFHMWAYHWQSKMEMHNEFYRRGLPDPTGQNYEGQVVIQIEETAPPEPGLNRYYKTSNLGEENSDENQ